MIGIVYLGPLGSIAGKRTNTYRPGYYYIVANGAKKNLKWNTDTDMNLATLRDWISSNINNYNNVSITTLNSPMGMANNLFYNCRKLTVLDLSNFNTNKVIDMSSMFYYCNNLTTLNVSNFNTSNVTNMSNMFHYCYNITTLDISNFSTNNVTNMSGMFESCTNLTTLNLSNFSTNNVTNMSGMFDTCVNITTLNLAKFNTSKVTNMSEMFYHCSNITTLNLAKFNTRNVTNMSEMFEYCDKLTTLNLSNFNTSKVTNMSKMFNSCYSIITLNLSNFSTNNVTNMSEMFDTCSNITTLNISNFNTSKVTNMSEMFEYCRNIKILNLSNFNTINVEYMNHMFSNCINLTTLDISNFNTSKVTNMSYMYSNTNNLSSDSLNSIANMLPTYPSKLSRANNSVLKYLGIMINNTALNSRLSSSARTTMTSKGWDLSLTSAVSADTLVNTLDGLVPASNLQINDRVYSYNEEEGIVEEDTINDIATEEVESTTYIIYLGEHIIKANKGCEFQKVVQVGNRQELQWISADKLKEDDNIVYTTGEIETITKIESYNEIEKRYAISLENNEIYCIGAINENAVRNRSISSKVNTSDVKLIFTKV